MKILIVEDDPDSRELQHVMLEASGYEALSAGNGKEALERLQNEPFDLIISDILMPVMDGFTLCRHVKSDPALAQIPFLFYTATYTGKDDRQLAQDVGADQYLIKPMPPDEFLAEVKALLASRSHTEHIQPREYEMRHAAALLRKIYEKKEQLAYTGDLLHTTEQRYKQIVEALNSHYFFYLYDTSHELKYVSPSAVIILGCANDQQLVSMMQKIIPQAGPDSDAREVELTRSDGSPCILKVIETPVTDASGQVIEYQGVAQDITLLKQREEERRKLEKALFQAQKMEVVGNMASGIAHDFNNMLMAITGYTELALEDIDKTQKTTPENLREILKAARRAEKLIKQMLTISRQDDEQKQTVEIGKIMNEATGLIRAALPKNITLSCSCSPECPPVMASETRLIQLLMNLCINAGHAIGSDRGTITLNAEPDQTAPGIILTVQDTGCGMARDIIEHMYEPYFTTKGRDEGTGLGLAIVHGIVKNHGGRIRVSSEPKKGTTFTIRLPAS